jgi:hypothetical protein
MASEPGKARMIYSPADYGKRTPAGKRVHPSTIVYQFYRRESLSF